MTNTDEPTFNAAENELQQLKRFAKNYGIPLLLGIVLLVGITMARTAYRNNAETSSSEASTLLANAVQVQDMDGKIRQLDDIIAQYPATPSAPLALLSVAKTYYDQQKCDVAMGKYDEFINTYPKHKLIKGAELGKLLCLEELGSKEVALKGYIAFAEENKDYFLLPEAMLGQARCLISLDRKIKARVACEDLIAAKPDSFWSIKAEEYLDQITSAPKKEVSIESAKPANTDLALPKESVLEQ